MPTKKPPNALQTIGNALDVPFYEVSAARRGGLGEMAKITTPEHMLSKEGLEDLNERYNLFSPEQLQVEQKQGDPLAGFFLKHPKIAGAAQFGAEFLNPSNIATGEVLGLAGKGLGMAGRALNTIPAVARATKPIGEIATKMASPFRPYAELRKGGGREAELQGRHLDQAKASADTKADAMLRPIFGGLTPQEAIEVERRSENFGAEGIKNPPRPVAGSTIPDAQLTARARGYRARLMWLDRQQLAAGVIDPERMRASQTYTPRWSKEAYDQTFGQNLPESTAQFMEERGGPMGGESRAFKRGSQLQRKKYLSFDEAEASGNLHPEYHSANNAIAHFRQRLTNVELQKNLEGFAPLNQLRKLRYGPGGAFGEGQAGWEEANKWAERKGASLASADVRNRMNLPARLIARSLPGKLQARLSEAGTAARRSGVMAGAAQRGAEAVENRGMLGVVDQAKRHEQIAAMLVKQSARVAELGNALQRHQLVRELSASASPELRAQAASLQQAYVAAKKLAGRTYRSGLGTNVDAILQRIAGERMDRPAGSNLTVIGEGENARTLGGRSSSGYGPYGKGDVEAVAAAMRKAGQKNADASAAMQQLDEAFNAIGHARSIVDDAARQFNIRRAGVTPQGMAASVKEMQESLRNAAQRARNAGAAARVPQGIAQGIGAVERGQNSLGGRLNAVQGRAIDAAMRSADNTAQAARVVAKRAFAGDAQAQKRFDSLAVRLADAKISAAQRDAYWKEFHRIEPEITAGIKSNLRRQAEKEALGAGFAPIDLVNTTLKGVPILKHSAVTPALAHFLEAYGAKRPEADALSRVIDEMNKLTRIGIISNPVVHVLWNLNNQFLGAGGDMIDLAKIYNPKWHPPQALVDAARAHGAIVSAPPSMQGLSGLDYGRLIGSRAGLRPSSLNPAMPSIRESVDRFATNIWDKNNAFTFGTMEEKFATLLYAKFIKKGMSEAEAGIAVRKALGDYANVSRTNIEAGLNKALFFYPWLKTIIPFWANALVVRPQSVNALMEGIRVNNLVGGDPNADKQRPFNVYLGSDAQGNLRYFSYPGPQKILGDLAEMAAPRGDIGAAPGPRLQAAEHVVQSHFNPTIGLGYDVINTIAKEPSDVGAPNFDILFDKDAPAGKQFQQFLLNAAERVIPAPMQAKQIFDFLRQLPTKGDVTGDVGAGVATGVLGGTNYDRPNPSTEKVIGSLRRRLTMVVGELRKVGRDDIAEQLWKKYEQDRALLTKGGEAK